MRPGPTLRAARHLRLRQLAHQVRRRVLGRTRRPRAPLGDGLAGLSLEAPLEPPGCEGEPGAEGGVRLFGRPPHDPLRGGWEPPGRDPLWCYTLHYHGWISHPACPPARARATLLDWIERHPAGVGWDAYPISMRVFHWLGWLSRNEGAMPPEERARVLGSLAGQLDHLARNVEVHLDGNHLWTNLAALAFAGLALEGPLAARLRAGFAARFAACVDDQLAPDGCHLERTPTYHCVTAEQLALVVEAARGAPPAERLAGALARMRAALPAFTHPDGDVALFGDSQLDAPANPERLVRRAGAALPPGDADAPLGGFARRQRAPWTVLWNAGGVGMPHQVGHIHGDALSFELSLGRERVLVDAGTGGYLPGPERRYARGTAAHNTVTVGPGDPDQYELWGSHRIGARTEPYDLVFEPGRLAGAIRGVHSPAAHRRELRDLGGGRLRCTDRVEGSAPATVRYFLPAGVTLEAHGAGFRARTPGGARFAIAPGDGVQLERGEAPGWTAVGRPRTRVRLSAAVPADGASVDFVALD